MNEKTTKTLLEKLEEEINQKSKQIDALRYALRLAEKEHNSAADMVANCPQNIYYEDWVKAEKVRGEYVATLKTIDAQLSKELDDLCAKCEQERQKAQAEPVDDYYEKAPLKNLPRNSFFRKLRNGKPTSRVWVRGYWDVAEKKYCCIAFDDVNEICFLKADTVVAYGFTF